MLKARSVGDYIRYGPNHLIVNTAEGMHGTFLSDSISNLIFL